MKRQIWQWVVWIGILALAPVLRVESSTDFKILKFYGIPGTEPVKLYAYPDHIVYEYKRYIILTRSKTGLPGEEIEIVSKIGRSPKVRTVIQNKNAEYFHGLYGHFLFIDSGTGPEPRQLMVYDIKKEKTVYTTSYASPLALEKGVSLVFWMETSKADKKIVREYQRRGLGGAAIESKVKLNLSNLTLAKTKLTRTAARQ